MGTFRADETLREVVSGAGFEFATSYQQMRIDHEGPLPLPEPPAGTAVRAGAFDEPTGRTFHTMMSSAFVGQDSAALPPYDEWLDSHEKSADFGRAQLTTVYESVGMRTVEIADSWERRLPTS